MAETIPNPKPAPEPKPTMPTPNTEIITHGSPNDSGSRPKK